MSCRDSRQAAEELGIFQAFLNASPSLAREIIDIAQPCQPFPDVTVKLRAESEVDFELVEWLHRQQTQEAKRVESLEASLLDALGEQGPNPSDHFRCVMLALRGDAKRFDPRDGSGFRSELFSLITETDQRWLVERYWRSPQGRLCRDFRSHPRLAKYLKSVRFWPSRVGNRDADPWPAGQDWIFFKLRGGFYSPGTAFRALLDAVEKKQNHYGNLGGRHVCLLVYYAQAVQYNTPYYGTETRGFKDVAAAAGEVLAGKCLIFEKIYLLQALEPDLQAFEVYPDFLKCQ